MPIVDYSELHGSPDESWGRFQFKATRKLVCDWDDRHVLANAFMTWPGADYPYRPGIGARVTEVGTSPMPGAVNAGTSTFFASYAKALITVVYETPNAESPRSADSGQVGGRASPIRFTETIQPMPEFVGPMPNNLFSWTSGVKPAPLSLNEVGPDAAPSVLTISWEYVFHVLNATVFPMSATSLVGKINSGSYSPRLSNLIIFEPGTLLYFGPVVTRTTEVGGANNAYLNVRDDDGARLDIMHRMIWKPKIATAGVEGMHGGWNEFFRAASPAGLSGFQKLWTGTNYDKEFKPYQTGDFSGITFG